MWDEIVKLVRAALYERTTSPLFGAYAVAWSVWNYKFLLTVFSELPIREKLDTFHVVFFPGVESYIYAFGIPLFGALLFIFVYPFPARWVYQFWRTQQKVLKEVRQKIDDETPLTKEEARELRHSLQRLEDEYQREVSHRNAEIQSPRERCLARQRASLITIARFFRRRTPRSLDTKIARRLNAPVAEHAAGLAAFVPPLRPSPTATRTPVKGATPRELA